MLLALALAAAAFASEPVSDAELSTMRGGFSLPGGLDVAMAVQTETSLNGNLLLRSVYKVDQGLPALQIFAPRVGETVRGTNVTAADQGDALQGRVSINFDRQNGVSISRQATTPIANVTVGSAAPTQEEAADGLQPLDLSSGPVETAGGRVSLSSLPAGARARIEGDGIDVSHVFGAAFGAVVANTGSDRTVDTSTTLTLDLRGATPFNLGSSLLRADALGAEAVRQMVVR